MERPDQLRLIIDRLNLWAKAPGDEHRADALKKALSGYKRGVVHNHYAPLPQDFCTSTPACGTPVVPLSGSFRAIFGTNEGATTSAAPAPSGSRPPWED